MARPTGKTSPTYNELRAEIRQGNYRNLYVLAGEEEFLKDRLVEALTGFLVEPSARPVDRLALTGETLEFNKLKAELQTPAFLSRAKLLIVRQSGWFAGQAKKVAAEDLIELFDQLKEFTCLVFLEEKVDKRQKKLVDAIRRAGVLAEFSRQSPRMLAAWIDGECKRKGLAIEPAAAESLIDRTEASMQQIWQELGKLFLYTAATGMKNVTYDLIDFISLPDLTGTVFAMTDALAAGQAGQALLLTDNLISQRQPVQLILFMLARHLRQLICAAELQNQAAIGQALQVPPFVASRLASQARRLLPNQLEKLYNACFTTDTMIKSGQISDRLGLETLLVESALALKKGRQD